MRALPVAAVVLMSAATPATADDGAAAARALAAARVEVSSASLVQYAGLGDSYVVKQLLAAGVPADEALPGRSLRALHNAAAQGHQRIVEQLIAAGAHVDAVDDKGCTALAAASWRGHIDVMHRLFQAGASASAGAPVCPALHQAVLGAQAAAVALLLNHGADPEQQDSYQRDARALARTLHREALLPAPAP